MRTIDNFSLAISAMLPQKIIDDHIKKWLKYAGSKDNERIWIGKRLIASFFIGLIGVLIPYSIFPLLNIFFELELYFDSTTNNILMILFGIIFFTSTMIVFYLHISYVIDGRRRMVESILPDFLFLVSSNLKSGMTPFSAFRSAVRPEFGPLSEEIKIATQKSLGISSFPNALREIANRIDSKTLHETANFFSQAIRSGGHLAQLIETSAKDIKQTQQLRNELITSTKMYMIFVLFVIIIASPILWSVSVQFLNVLISIQTQTTTMTGATSDSAEAAIGLAGGAITIEPEFMQTLAYGVLTINSVLAGIFMGTISGGKIRDGLKFAPFIMVASYIIFSIAVEIVGAMVLGAL
jgi:archaeal flagellar protein FlaJ